MNEKQQNFHINVIILSYSVNYTLAPKYQQTGGYMKLEKGTVENRVIIRIWESKVSLLNPKGSVGHVSIEFDGEYVSFWPAVDMKQSVKTAINGAFFKLSATYNEYKDDEKAEKCPADKVICLYNLDVNAINSEYGRMKDAAKDKKDDEKTGWSLFGKNVFFPNSDQHSCTSFCLELLKFGGLEVKGIKSGTFSSVTPGDLVTLAEKSRKIERENSDNINNFSFQSETQDTPASNCLVM